MHYARWYIGIGAEGGHMVIATNMALTLKRPGDCEVQELHQFPTL